MSYRQAPLHGLGQTHSIREEYPKKFLAAALVFTATLIGVTHTGRRSNYRLFYENLRTLEQVTCKSIQVESLRMKNLLFVTTCLSILAGAASSQEAAHVFKNPCDRGPVATWKIVNNSRSEFVTFLQGARPDMPLDVAEQIAFGLCDDLKLLNDDEGLTRRLNLLIQESGY